MNIVQKFLDNFAEKIGLDRSSEQAKEVCLYTGKKPYQFETYYDVLVNESVKVVTMEEYIDSLNSSWYDNDKRSVSKALYGYPQMQDLEPKLDRVATMLNRKKMPGRCTKEFMLVDTDQFGDLFQELTSSNNPNYRTYLGNSLYQSDSTPDKVCVLSKLISLPLSEINYAMIEEMSSKILNTLGVKTVYNKTCITNTSNEYNPPVVSPNYAVLSVNFLGDNEEFYTTADCINASHTIMPEPLTINNWNRALDEAYSRVVKRHHLLPNEEEKHELLLDQYRSFISRVFVLNDTDYSIFNSGIIYNKDTDQITSAPNFDMEFAGGHTLSSNMLSTLQSYKEFDKADYEKYIARLQASITPDPKTNITPIRQNIYDSCNGVDKYACEHYSAIYDNINQVIECSKVLDSGITPTVVTDEPDKDQELYD